MGSRRNGDEFDIQADKVPEHRRHNDVVGKENAIYWILENAIPGDHEDEEKEYGKKRGKSSKLKVELSRLWNRTTKGVPLVNGALGTIPYSFQGNQHEIEVKPNVSSLQMSTMLGITNILGKVLVV